MTTANKLTILRVLLIPLFMWMLYAGFPWSSYAAIAIFIIAAVTDAVDGYIARNYNQITDFGKLMDPLADKLLVAAALICFVEFGYIPAWAVVVVISREFIVTGIRVVAMSANKVLAASNLGKFKTVSQIIAIVLILIDRGRGLFVAWGCDLVFWALMVTVVFTIWSGFDYVYKNRELLHVNKQ